jgi:hypothetical protein
MACFVIEAKFSRFSTPDIMGGGLFDFFCECEAEELALSIFSVD